MRVRFFDIEWETDGEPVDLPTDVILDVAADIDIAEQGAEVLSQHYDFLVQGFSFELCEPGDSVSLA